MTDVQLCDHYINLLHGLNNHGLNLALEIKLTNNMVEYGNVDKTITAITQVLTAFLINDECVVIAADDSARVLTITGKDPKKTGINTDETKGPPTKPCRCSVAASTGPRHASKTQTQTSRHRRKQLTSRRLPLPHSPIRRITRPMILPLLRPS